MRLYVDLRCLQDPAYAFRGIGQHSAAILRHARQGLGSGPLEIIGLVDERFAEVPTLYRSLVDSQQHSLVPQPGKPGDTIFLQLSPMTHEPARLAPLLGRANVLACAIIYDFIPLDDPSYLRATNARRTYMD